MANPIKPTLKTEFIPWLLILLMIGAGIYFYNNLPERVAAHWNFSGQIDSYGPGQAQAIILPLAAIATYVLFLLLPYLDPKKERHGQFSKVYYVFKAMFLFLVAAVYFVVGLNGLGYNLPVGVIIPGLIGLTFIIIGNYMGKIKMNWFMGIRTPWALSSEEVWDKTHRFGGKMFFLAGILMWLEIILPNRWKLPIFIIAILILLVGTTGYSYIVYSREKKSLNN